METQTAVTPLRAGDRRQRQFPQHGTPKPIFFDKPSHPSSLSVKRTKRSRPSTCLPPCSPLRSAPPIQRYCRRLDYRFGADTAKSVSFGAPNSPLQFQHFDQRFRKIRLLGEGDFGKVYEVERKSDRNRFAIKKSIQPYTSKTDRDRKFEEVRAFELLPRHPNILRFIQAWEEKQHLFIQTELCVSSLQQYLDEKPVDSDMGWQLFIDILTGLDHIHEHGFIHLDIKPDNILIGQDGRYKIGDLGLMNGRNRADSQKEYREGDNRFMAPETLQNIFTTRADVFSLGMTILSTICDIELPKNGDLWIKLRTDVGLSTLAEEDLQRLPSDMQVLICEMIRADFNMRPSCRDLLNNKIITGHTPYNINRSCGRNKRSPYKKLKCMKMYLTNKTRDIFGNNNPDTVDTSRLNDDPIYRERSPAITPSSANRRSSGGTASPSGRSPQMSPLSTRFNNQREDAEMVPAVSSRLSKNLLSLFDDQSDDDDDSFEF